MKIDINEDSSQKRERKYVDDGIQFYGGFKSI